jgi:lycopene beta-cyclase
MDFRVHQQAGTTFAYVLPVDAHTALVEYTLFTPELLAPEQYDLELRNYIRDYLNIQEYTIREEEFGIIPMTDEKFQIHRNGVIHIGTAGGQTKASSGYTFRFIQKQSDEILRRLLKGESLTQLKGTPWRFRFYDNTLLHILFHKSLPGNLIFPTLFRKNKATQVLKFLDNESTFVEELGIISSLPTWPFLKAALKQLR